MDDHNPGSIPDVGSDGSNYSINGKIMFSAILIVFGVVFIMVCLHLYARWYLIRARRRNLHSRSQIVFYVDPSALQSSGIDAAVLKSIPVFCYDSKTHPVDMSPECAVCLSEFEESEKVRKLPKCGHHFHLECIDMWFHSHSTCPLCRSMVEPVQNSIEVVVEPATVHNLPGSSSSSSNGGAAIPATTSFGSRRNLSFSIEVPKREGCLEELRDEISASQSFKSPGSRIMRILSRGLSMSSSAGTSGGNVNTPNYGGGELDIEKGESESRMSPAESSR